MSAKATSTEAPKPYCSIKCECGKTHGNYLNHYDRLRASCGKIFWALQPKRDGPLVLKPWPGMNLNRAEMVEKYGAEEEEWNHMLKTPRYFGGEINSPNLLLTKEQAKESTCS